LQKLLVVEPAEIQRRRIEGGLTSRAAGIQVVFAGSLNEAMRALREGDVRGVLAAPRFPHGEAGGRQSGAAELLDAMKREMQYQPVIVHSDTLMEGKDKDFSEGEKEELVAKGVAALFRRSQLIVKTLPFLRAKMFLK